MAKKPAGPAAGPTHYRIKLGRSIRHPEHEDVLLTPRGDITVTAAVKAALGDAVIEATPVEAGEV